jgi:hypothetical protein
LGIEVARSRTSIKLSQRKYVLDFLKETGLLGVRPVDIPMDPNHKLVKDEGEVFDDPSRYHHLVGKLNYLTITRLDISYAVNVVSQFLEAPRVSYWEAITCIIQYLKRAPRIEILHRPNGHLWVERFADVDWKSKKQTVVARSSAITPHPNDIQHCSLLDPPNQNFQGVTDPNTTIAETLLTVEF